VYIFYSVLLFGALLALLPVYVFRLEALRGRGLHLGQRLGWGIPPRDPRRKAVWIHAVSVGEVLSLQSLVAELRRRHPGWEIYFSTLTDTGYRLAGQRIKGADHIFFVPFDFGWSVGRVLKAVRPSVLVLAESEFWPNLLRLAHLRGVKVILANGRVSDRSFRRYRLFRRLASRLWAFVDLFLVQTPQDRTRLEELGAAAGRIEVTGNLKSEIRLRPWTRADIARMKSRIGLPPGARIVVAGSTREGEEALLLQGFRDGRKRDAGVFLILAPRHPGRVDEVERACRAAGWSVGRRTTLRPGQKWDVLILDTLGELADFYALSDAAFVGGSLVPWGGHNILEPAFYGKPVFFGPYMHNFAHLARTFVREGGARILESRADIGRLFDLRDGEALRAQGARAKRTLASLQGATARTIEFIARAMGE
jgi:3-deoxy-D-manno-octulosonic-acid transferase